MTDLAVLRRARFASVKEVAEKVGVDESTAWRWENGIGEPRTQAHRKAYAKALGITVAKLGQLVYSGAVP